MSETKEIKPVISEKLLLGSSLLAHFLGSWLWLAGIDGDVQGIREALTFSAFFIMGEGVLHLLGTWFFVTLPLSALCMHHGVEQRLLRTTLLGAISCVLVGVALLAFFGALVSWGGSERMVGDVLSCALLGGSIAALFSLFNKLWGKRQVEDSPLGHLGNIK